MRGICRPILRAVLATLGAAMLGPAVGAGQDRPGSIAWRDHPAIAYDTRPTADPVARLIGEMERGLVELEWERGSGYLRSVLTALQVPLDSQIAVFAEDSLQARRIALENPRTIFFNDEVAVAWVRGGFIEVASQDPAQGVIFYALDRTWLGRPRLARRNDCLSCHAKPATQTIPGMLMHVDHRTPVAERWTGWYVTGDLGSVQHFGNAAIDRLFSASPPQGRFNWPSLEGKFDRSGYLTPYSDVGALMVFEHQMQMMNLLARVGWTARVSGDPDNTIDAAAVGLDQVVREAVDYMLFIDEPPIPGRLRGTSGFAERFGAQGPRDRRGRSLRQLDLATRLLRYPCSYLIYSQQFDSLPVEAKSALYRRLWDVLSGVETDARYSRLSLDARRAIVEILRDTKPQLPDYFRPLPADE